MPNLGESRIGQIAIGCTSVARARRFYEEVLGLRHLFDAGPNLSFFDCNGTRLMLSDNEGDSKGNSTLYFFIGDIDATKGDLSAKGAAFIGEPHMIAQMPDHQLWIAEFRDSEGNVLALMEERR